MDPVSVYRVGAVGAGSSYVFGGQTPDCDLGHAAWLGWLPLRLLGFAGPGIAIVGDTWLTAPSGRSDRQRGVVAGDIVPARDAAGELLVRPDRGLAAFGNRPAQPSSEGSVVGVVARGVGR